MKTREADHTCEGCGHAIEWGPEDDFRLELHIGRLPAYRIVCGSCGRDNRIGVDAGQLAERLALVTGAEPKMLTDLGRATCPDCGHGWRPGMLDGKGHPCWFLRLEVTPRHCHLRLSCPGCGGKVLYSRRRRGMVITEDDARLRSVFLGELVAMYTGPTGVEPLRSQGSGGGLVGAIMGTVGLLPPPMGGE